MERVTLSRRTLQKRDELARSRITDNGFTYYKCEDCGKTLSTSYNFLIHRNTHTGERPYTCHVCGKSFHSASGLNRHVRDVHTGIKKFPCDICGRCLASRASRDEHRRTHTGERPHVCETCGKSFKQKASLHVHRSFHSNRFPHECPFCEQSFRRKQELTKHVFVHTEQKPYPCDICDKRFRSKGCISRHKRPRTLPEESQQELAPSFAFSGLISDVCLFYRWKTKSSGVARILKIKNESTNKEGIEYVQCVRCNTIFVNMQYFIDHMNTEHSVQIHYCQYCKLAYSQGKDFEEHMKTHGTSYEEPKDATKDDTVERSTDVEKDSLQDKKATNEETEKFSSFTCNLCGRTFRKKWVLENHIYRHTEINWGENTSETELVRKAQQKINNRLSYKCDTCKKIILTKRGFLRHIRVHFDKRPCTCDLCGKSYRIEQDLARHIRDVHDGLKKYACDICGRAFANKGAKDDHRRIHTGERPYACEHCPKMFRTLNSIYVHNRIHTDYKPHKCSYCEKCFRSRQRLTNHETTHTRIKAFVCEICGKSFSVKGEVVRHKATHNEEKPFDCKCGMKFGQKRYLKSHIKQHHKEASS
ncbi:uncharacterized protein LOC143179557 [Calliopsis andreniformis]|uniref:uncharacterized protein LOC143179557 n=1 Tax=Calliopsis andreniformis TaxID=337506 RepID=UPI003FCD0D9C